MPENTAARYVDVITLRGSKSPASELAAAALEAQDAAGLEPGETSYVIVAADPHTAPSLAVILQEAARAAPRIPPADEPVTPAATGRPAR